MFQLHPPILHTEQWRQREHPSQSQPTPNPETHPVPQSLTTLDHPCELISTVIKMEQLRPHGSWNPRPYKEGSGSEWISTLFPDKIVIVESVRRKWPKPKGQILHGEENGQKQKVKSCQVLFSFLGFKNELLFSKDICKPLDKIVSLRRHTRVCVWKITSGAIDPG